MTIHKTKAGAIKAIKQFANTIREAQKATGADFLADADDDSGMEYYIEARYRGQDKKIHMVMICFQELNL